MQTTELPLFSAIKTPILIPQQKEITPPQTTVYTPDPHTVITNALGSIFSTPAEEGKVTKTRRILGETAKTFSDEHIETIITQFQFPIDTWMDEYERDVFSGLTLKEVINEK